ncbi:MAG: ABC transporter ATP-binding protein [Desulfobacter sp.]|nr:ABC transporter ATP-binding protein [Desulfobacter sp.]WDP84830.1 MAG: ABC transporter ATP-binding protein [Desulfobacter sp.]
MTLSPILDIQDLGLSFAGRRVLEKVSFSIMPGQIVSVIGPNGAGKTSLVRAVSKQLPLSQGNIFFDQTNIRTLDNSVLARKMAVVRQAMDPLPMTVQAYVRLGRLPFFTGFQFFETRKDKDLASEYMRVTGISHLALSSMDRISGGERQLAALARALTQEPRLLVLDEPTAHLDITHQAKILDLISDLRNSLGLTVLMVIHDLNLAAEYSDSLVLINKDHGGIHAMGTPKKVLTRENILDVYHTRVKTAKNPVSKKPCIFLNRWGAPSEQ